jgi:hypothetical protein
MVFQMVANRTRIALALPRRCARARELVSHSAAGRPCATQPGDPLSAPCLTSGTHECFEPGAGLSVWTRRDSFDSAAEYADSLAGVHAGNPMDLKPILRRLRGYETPAHVHSCERSALGKMNRRDMLDLGELLERIELLIGEYMKASTPGALSVS